MKPLTHHILMTDFDRRRLKGLLQVLRRRSGVDAWNLNALELELERAEVVPPTKLPAGIVTMNSQVRVHDLETGERMSVSLVFPGSPDPDAANVPVLSPLGLALLGCREGDVIAWETPAGPQRLRVDAVIYQPEASGHYFI